MKSGTCIYTLQRLFIIPKTFSEIRIAREKWSLQILVNKSRFFREHSFMKFAYNANAKFTCNYFQLQLEGQLSLYLCYYSTVTPYHTQ